jgi:hypothetical protein
VQQYVEDSRISKAKADLTEIRNALVRFETDQSTVYLDTTISRLVGPYLSKGMADPWGSPYIIAPLSSKCYSIGPDRIDASGDEISMDFRPPLAISKVFWEDSNNNITVDTGDNLIIKFTRPMDNAAGPSLVIGTDFLFSEGAPANDFSAKTYSNNDMVVKLTLDFGAAPLPYFRPGFATIEAIPANTIVDGAGNTCKSGQATVIKAF